MPSGGKSRRATDTSDPSVRPLQLMIEQTILNRMQSDSRFTPNFSPIIPGPREAQGRAKWTNWDTLCEKGPSETSRLRIRNFRFRARSRQPRPIRLSRLWAGYTYIVLSLEPCPDNLSTSCRNHLIRTLETASLNCRRKNDRELDRGQNVNLASTHARAGSSLNPEFFLETFCPEKVTWYIAKGDRSE